MSQMHQDPQLNISADYKKSLLNWLLFEPMPKTDAQDCDSVDWAIEMHDWASQVANNTGCPPDTCHVFGCDRCYETFDFYIRIIEWSHTDEGARYLREQKHWSWHSLFERQEIDLIQPRNDILQDGDRDWMLIGRQSPPASMPVFRNNRK